MATPTLKRFDTEQDLIDYAHTLNESGTWPVVALMDSAGIQLLACQQAPGGDGWGFAYYGVNDEDGTIRNTSGSDELNALATPLRYLGEGPRIFTDADLRAWEPTWPAFGIVSDPTASQLTAGSPRP